MNERGPARRRARDGVAAVVTVALAAAAVLALGYRILLALGREDAAVTESTLVMMVARQVEDGPGGLYGPFGGRNPLVLIHAPLYYRCAALLAWPLARAGLEPLTAALAAGRGLSVLALVALLAVVAGLARLGGAPRRAGRWAALLVAAAPVVDALPVMVRADMLGVALQAGGVLLVLRALGPGRPGGALIPAAYLAFAAAFCVKQTLVVAPAVSTALLAAARVRGRLPSRPLEQGVLLALALVGVVYGAEGLVTGGRVFAPVFTVAAGVARLRPSDWVRALGVLGAAASWSLGITALLTAAGLAVVAARPGALRRGLAAVSAGLLVATLALYAAGGRERWFDTPHAVGCLVLPLLVLASAAVEPRGFLGGPVDAALWVYWAAEFALMVALFKSSTGSWINYAVPSVVLGCVLTARCLARAFDGASSARPLVPSALAALAVPYLAWVDVSEDHQRRAADRTALAAIATHVGRDPRAFYFIGRPDLNRLHGRTELVCDDWLYPVFESLRLAEPRSVWLRQALTSGSIRHAVAESTSPRIDGIPEDLHALGFRPTLNFGPFFVWEAPPRDPAPRAPTPGP